MKVKSLAVVLTLFSSIIVSLLAAENDREVREIDRYLRGSKILTTHREGGPLYGKRFVTEAHFCPSGKFFLKTHWERHTILDNFEQGGGERSGI